MINKTIFIPVLLGVVALSIGENVAQFRKAKAYEARISLLASATSNGEAKIINRYIHDSVEHVVIKEVPVKTAAEKSGAVGSGYLDTLTRALKIAVKQVDEVTKVNADLRAERVALRETINNKFEYSDKWLRLIYDKDSNTVDFNYDVSLNVVKYWKRSWPLGQKKYYNDIYSDDKRVSVSAVKRFTLEEKKQKRLGLGISAGYCYSPFANRWEPYLGLGISYHFLEF
jgi:hypothetical protein